MWRFKTKRFWKVLQSWSGNDAYSQPLYTELNGYIFVTVSVTRFFRSIFYNIWVQQLSQGKKQNKCSSLCQIWFAAVFRNWAYNLRRESTKKCIKKKSWITWIRISSPHSRDNLSLYHSFEKWCYTFQLFVFILVSVQDTYMNIEQFEFLELIPEAHVEFHFQNLFWIFCIYINVCQYVSCCNL